MPHHLQPGILIAGPGSVGGALAARWVLAGQSVLLLSRDKASETRLVRNGIFFTARNGSRRRAGGPKLQSARRSGPRPCAAVFFCVKSKDIPDAVRSTRPWVGPATSIVGLQNGLGHEKTLHRAFGKIRTVLGSCYFAADRPAPFSVSNSWGNTITLAQTKDNRQAAATARKLLLKGGWMVSLKNSEDRMLWTKLCFNAATNPLASLCAVPNGSLAENPALKEIMLTVLAETVAIATKSGHPPLYHDMDALVVRSCQAAPLQRNSMLQDLAAGRKTEIESIAGPLLAAGCRAKTPAPLLTRLSRLIRRLERLT
ncbi:MAG: hypothetical protein A3J74_04945 [Elusimicrobia bacterium RIFCSPHIGHO2_02_FULL_57_9]|nr:MAG: hypothetical protein A3J74_04945 [Elusimicrobia bacterium RIFCSPHIGHO2_02_FULL_57_9]